MDEIYTWPWRELKINPEDLSITTVVRAPKFDSSKHIVKTIPASMDTIKEKTAPLNWDISGIYYSPDFNGLILLSLNVEHRDIGIRKMVECVCIGVPSPETTISDNKFEMKETLIIGSRILKFNRPIYCLVSKKACKTIVCENPREIIENTHELYMSKLMNQNKNENEIKIYI